MTTDYPIVANCNFSSGDDNDRAIHAARLALDGGLTDDDSLIDAMEALEAVLSCYAERQDAPAVERCTKAEAEVLAAWLDVRADVERARIARYRD